MSSPRFSEQRGLPGNLVATKAMLYPDARHREMLFFLQAVSLRPGGLRELAREVLNRWPERIGCAAMHEAADKGLREYDEDTVEAIREELAGAHWVANQKRPVGLGNVVEWGCEKPELALQRSRELAEKLLPDFLEEFCLNPDIEPSEMERAWWIGWCPYVTNLWASLACLKTEAESACRAAGVVPSIGAKVNSTLDYALRTKRMVVIEGSAGSGKTTACAAWAARHQAQARMISLSGITHRTGFFQKIAAVIGLATCQRKSSELQAKVEAFFYSTRLMLVFDEAHYLFPQTKRVTCAPELVDWINTALVNQGVPVALVTTDQFVRLKETVEKQTGWTSEQLMHRIARYSKLPEKVIEEDLFAVARFELSKVWDAEASAWIPDSSAEADRDAVKFVVGYALISRLPLAAVRDSIDEARDAALTRGARRVTFEDLERAREEFQIPSDLAMKKAFSGERSPTRRRTGNRDSEPTKAFVAPPREGLPGVPVARSTATAAHPRQLSASILPAS